MANDIGFRGPANDDDRGDCCGPVSETFCDSYPFCDICDISICGVDTDTGAGAGAGAASDFFCDADEDLSLRSSELDALFSFSRTGMALDIFSENRDDDERWRGEEPSTSADGGGGGGASANDDESSSSSDSRYSSSIFWLSSASGAASAATGTRSCCGRRDTLGAANDRVATLALLGLGSASATGSAASSRACSGSGSTMVVRVMAAAGRRKRNASSGLDSVSGSGAADAVDDVVGATVLAVTGAVDAGLLLLLTSVGDPRSKDNDESDDDDDDNGATATGVAALMGDGAAERVGSVG